jgi:S-adenosyl-L-methionine hydrolase (adenosine-forming)
MAIITFTSDYGQSDFYVAAVKAKILTTNPESTIVDVSHQVKLYDIIHAAFLVRSVFKDFPEGTVHLIAINEISLTTKDFIAACIENHYFLVPNNGILSLISEQPPTELVLIKDIADHQSSFPVKDLMAPIAAKIASGGPLIEFGEPINEIVRSLPRYIKATKKQIVGNVMRIDIYGNLITNIPKDVFELLNPGKFKIEFRKEIISEISKSYLDVENADAFAIFNSANFLEIGILNGNGSNLLGLKEESAVYINFEREE